MAYVKELIVKFNEGNTLREVNGQLLSPTINLGKFFNVIGQVSGASARQSYPRLSDRLRRIHQSTRPGIPTLELFVRVHLRTAPTHLGELINDLEELDDVASASIALRPSTTPPTDPPNYEPQQFHLDPTDGTEGGVNARAAWSVPGGDGSGDGTDDPVSGRIRICDCEWSYFGHDDHPDISLPTAELPTDMHELHGTRVLGVLAALPNDFGVTGVAPGAALSFASVYNSDPDPQTLGDPIETYGVDAATGDPPDDQPDFRNLRRGDVLLVELVMMVGGSNEHLPSDGNRDTWTAIHRVSDTLGIAVILPAGNRGISLDTDPAAIDSEDERIWQEGHADYKDSMAIIVGAGKASSAAGGANPHSKLDSSNWGTRVDCQGWGEHIYTTGGGLPDGEQDQSRKYTGDFGQTSGAAAMIAGVVACLQGARRGSGAPDLSPDAVRGLLKLNEYGTPQPDDAPDNHVGPLPNLGALLGLSSNVYIRDNVADQGAEPYVGTVLYRSPDIIVEQNLPTAGDPDPAEVFGVGSWDDEYLSEPVLRGQDNYVYVRMQNIGAAQDDVRITVYWAEPGSFIHPATWTANVIGSVDAPAVQGGEYRVADPITWNQADIPGDGSHYCLIAVLEDSYGSVEIPDAFAGVDEFLQFTKNYNNVCYRNIQVVEAETTATEIASYRFIMYGLPAEMRGPRADADQFTLRLGHRLPPGTELHIEALDKMNRMGPRGEPVTIEELTPGERLIWDSRTPWVLENVVLRRGAKIPLRIRPELTGDAAPGIYRIHIDQFLNDPRRGRQHLGRVNYDIRLIDPNS